MNDEPRYPHPLPHADTRANLRCVAADLYVGGATAILERPTPTRVWWAAIDLHGVLHPESFRREAAFADVGRCLRWGFQDGAPVPDGLLDAALGLVRGRRGAVLVSCAAGVSRSVSVAYALLRGAWGLGHDEALAAASCGGGRPLADTLASARRWAEARNGRAACGACGGTGSVSSVILVEAAAPPVSAAFCRRGTGR